MLMHTKRSYSMSIIEWLYNLADSYHPELLLSTSFLLALTFLSNPSTRFSVSMRPCLGYTRKGHRPTGMGGGRPLSINCPAQC